MKNRTLIAVEQQITAMGCEVYEIGLFKPHTPDSGPSEPEMLPRTWDRATLIKSVRMSMTRATDSTRCPSCPATIFSVKGRRSLFERRERIGVRAPPGPWQ